MKKINNFLFLHLAFFIYALGSLCSKSAGVSESKITFLMFYAGCFLCLFIYAILWQRILKNTSLIIAYLNKGVTILWGILFGILFFHETIGIMQIFGIIFVIAGISVVNYGDAK